MQRVIGVECWADCYFFGRLLNDTKVIRKEKNKDEVLKSIIERSKGGFSIGIVDRDKGDLSSGFILNKVKVEVEASLELGAYTTVNKLAGKPQFIIELKPKEFEFWVNEFLRINAKSVIDFGYASVKEFMDESKSRLELLLTQQRFLAIMDFIFAEYKGKEEDNHIHKLKRVLAYLIEKNYQADINELINV